MSTRQTGRGFTLVELLVVIAIIGILLTILSPSVRRMHVLSKRVTCCNNLHQYAIALLAYTADHQNIFPTCHSGGQIDQNVDNTWLSAVYAYGSRERLGRCPAIEGKQIDYGAQWDWAWTGHHNGYGYNMWFLGGSHQSNRQGELDGTSIPMYRDTRMSEVMEPGLCLMVADSNVKTSGGADYGCTISLFWPYAGPDRYREGVAGVRHENAGSTGYVDGHCTLVEDPDNNINPPYCGARKYLEIWDHRQRIELGK